MNLLDPVGRKNTGLPNLVLPRLSGIEGELRAFRGEVEGQFQSMHSEVKRLDCRVDGLRSETVSRFEAIGVRLDSIEKRLDLREKITALESQVKALERARS